MCELKDFEHLKLDPYHRGVLERELGKWHKTYLPLKRNIETVLDVGAGNGETAQFYLNHGAKTVICVEPDAKLLSENFANDPRIVIVPHAPDFIKLDGEGCERDMVFETHFLAWLKAIDRTTMLTLWRLEGIPVLGKYQGFRFFNFFLRLHMIRAQFFNVLRGCAQVLGKGGTKE
jgi:hypothetical protein